MKQLLIYSLLCSILVSCEPAAKTSDSPPVVKVGERELSKEEFRQLNFIPGTAKDSLQMAKKILERWAQDELFYQEAQKKLFDEDLNVTAEIEKFKKELINYRYEIKLIENNLDTTVTKVEIEDYYNSNPENFVLKDNIVKVNYVKIPLASKALDKIKRCIYSANPKDKEQLVSLCQQYAENYFINDSTWLLLEDVKKEIPPLKDLPEYNFYTGRSFDYSDALNYYYLRIKEIKVKNTLSPLNFETKNIKNILLNRRKMQLIKEYKQQLFEKAKADNTLKIY